MYVDLFCSAGQVGQTLSQASLRGRLLKKSIGLFLWPAPVQTGIARQLHKFTFRQKAIVWLCSLGVSEHVIHPSISL